MKDKGRGHLSADQLARLTVEGSEAPVDDREHLRVCADCRAEHDRLGLALARLGEQARRSVPKSRVGIVLPEERNAFRVRPWAWGGALAGVAAMAAILVMVWFDGGQGPEIQSQEAMALETLSDETLMAEVAGLEDNPLSPVSSAIIDQAGLATVTDEFLDFVVPGLEEDIGLTHEEGGAC